MSSMNKTYVLQRCIIVASKLLYDISKLYLEKTIDLIEFQVGGGTIVHEATPKELRLPSSD